MTDPTEARMAQELSQCLGQRMARHAVTRLQPLEGQEALIFDDPALGVSTSHLHLTWAHPDDQGTLMGLAGGTQMQAAMNEQAFYDDLLQTLHERGFRGVRLLPGSRAEFRPIEGQPGRLAFLLDGVRFIRA